MGYDQDIYNKVGTLEAEVFNATKAYAVASATKQALDVRVATFKADLSVAQGALSTAQDNLAAACNGQKSILGTMIAAVHSTYEAMVIYTKVQSVFENAIVAAQQMSTTGYSISDVLAKVSAAEAKNSYMTPQLLAGAQNADNTAATAAAAADTALENAMTAFVAAERSLWASALVLAAIIDLQRLVGGYLTAPTSDAPEIPDALDMVPSVMNLLTPTRSPLDFNTPLPLAPDLKLKQWMYLLVTGSSLSDDQSTWPAYLQQPLDAAVQALLEVASTGASPPPAPLPAAYSEGLLSLMSDVQITAAEREGLLQAATTEATIEQSLAAQDQAKKKAALDAAKGALAAAHQAVDR